ncbi:hypothetical protein D3C80_1646780 [compost metagenome]
MRVIVFTVKMVKSRANTTAFNNESKSIGLITIRTGACGGFLTECVSIPVPCFLHKRIVVKSFSNPIHKAIFCRNIFTKSTEIQLI